MTSRLLRRSPFRSTGRAARWAVAVLALLLLLMNLAGWVGFSRLVRTQEEIAVSGAETTARFIAGVITPGNLFFLDAAYDPLTGTTDFETAMEYADLPLTELQLESVRDAVEAAGEGYSLQILSPTGVVLVDATGFAQAPQPAEYAEEDAALIRAAASGVSASNRDDLEDPVKRAYEPLRSEDGEVIGVLRLSTRSDQLFPREQVIRRLTASAIIATGLILFLWFTLARLLRSVSAAERAMVQSDRLRALGTATAGIAHEIRNPLGIILLSLEELRAEAAAVSDEKTKQNIESAIADLEQEARRLNVLTDQFLDFARDRPEKVAPEVIDAAGAARETLRLFAKGLPTNITLDESHSEAPLPVAFGEGRLRQVLLNLLRNAQEACSERACTIRFSVREHRGRARLVVEDTGAGMDPQTLARVFDPFYTTRAQGSGLGLPLSRSLVENAGGSLELQSKPGKGTTVVLELPLAKK